MNKIGFALILLSCVALFVSCNKSGVYSPKEKLSSVWYGYELKMVLDGDPIEYKDAKEKYQREAWEWDGKELKSRIVYGYDKTVLANYVYEYKGKQITGITSMLPSEKKNRIRFIYDDNKKLKEIKYFTEVFSDVDLPYIWLEFTYDGNKVSSIKETINTQKYPSLLSTKPSLLASLLPDGMADFIEEDAVRAKIEYDSEVNEYAFKWDKKNISEVTVTTKNGNETTVANISYTYDENRNPFKARVAGYVEDTDDMYMIVSKNNIVSCTYSDSERTVTENCQYTYDKKKFPVEKVVERVSKRSHSTTTVKETWTYEYAD